MSYQVLARKWRPKDFSELVGQQHVLQALMNALDQNRLHHAYLFTGTRGVGKTSIARILAKCLNCEKSVSSKPCQNCETCKTIDAGRFIDLIEIDAASRTNVEDMRDLIDNVPYAPSQGRYKVYLIDEVHMLSKHSFNALLKTLEEPPAHVIFIFATTDPQKLPVTILSRTLQFHLKNMASEQIATHLAVILKAEAIAFEEAALWHVARAANGSMRDALSLLDQAIAFASGNLTDNAIQQMLGTIEHRFAIEILTALAERNAATLYQQTQQLAERGIQFDNALEMLLTLLHEIALAHLLSEIPNGFITPAQQLAELKALISSEDTQLFYEIALRGRRDLNLGVSQQQSFMMTLLRMLTFQPVATTQSPPPATVPITKPTKPQQTIKAPQPDIDNTLTANWGNTVSQLSLTGMSKSLAEHCIVERFADNCLHLCLDQAYASLHNPRQEDILNQALSAHCQTTIKVQIRIDTLTTDSPAKQAQAKVDAAQQKAQATIAADPNVQAIMAEFDAIIPSDAIRPTKSTASKT